MVCEPKTANDLPVGCIRAAIADAALVPVKLECFRVFEGQHIVLNVLKTHVPPTAYIGGYIMSAFRKSDDVLFYSILFCSILFSIIYSHRYR